MVVAPVPRWLSASGTGSVLGTDAEHVDRKTYVLHNKLWSLFLTNLDSVHFYKSEYFYVLFLEFKLCWRLFLQIYRLEKLQVRTWSVQVFPNIFSTVRCIASLYEPTCKVGNHYSVTWLLNTRQANFKAKYSTPVRPRTIDFTLVLCIANYCIL